APRPGAVRLRRSARARALAGADPRRRGCRPGALSVRILSVWVSRADVGHRESL
ncbi:hypothetical protein XPN_1460, partial [Xanthomonas arboricola pv. pruni MAFF 301427]